MQAKIIGAFAAAGFLLSFVSGMCSRSGNVGHIFGVAVIFTLAFAGLGALVQWLTGGVLNVNAAGEDGAMDDAQGAETAAQKGATIDVVVKDEELPSDENSPRFFVGNNHQMLNPSDYGASDAQNSLATPAEVAAASGGGTATNSETRGSAASGTQMAMSSAQSATAAEQTGMPSAATTGGDSSLLNDATGGKDNAAEAFVPITLGGEKLQSTTPDTGAKAAAGKAPVDDLEDELDEIPEFQGFAAAEDDGSSRNIGGELIEDSDFSQAGAPIKAKKKGAEMQDAALMAKAISTVLAQEK